MINVENLGKSYGPQTLFRNASFLIGSQEKIGIVGPNGAGKSTFFKILMGEDDADVGEVRAAKTVKKSLLRQEWIPVEGDTILQSTLRIHKDWFDAYEALTTLSPLSPEYHTYENSFFALGGYEVEPRAKMILSGLGFTTETMATPCELLSGGWRMRVQLAGLLLSEPDLLLLDEPTNHLDVESVVWFEDFLVNYSKTFMMISHDRRLIERLSTSILEFTPPKITLWPVSFRKFEEDKAVRMAQIASEVEGMEKEVARLEAFANRFKAKASKAKQAQSKLRASEKVQEELEKIQGDMPLIGKRNSTFNIKLSATRIPKTSFTFEKAVFGYEKLNPLFALDHCVVEGGKKIGIIGVNGVGKSTFLKTCAGELPLLSGSVRRNESLKVGYFAQHRLEELPLKKTAYAYLDEGAPGLSIGQIRGVAASLGLTANDLDKPISALSGGEKARLSLSKLILEKPDIFLLDEPTNHLDIEACDAMIEGLKKYEGSVLVVSHNRDFLDQLVDQILEVQPEAAWVHLGNYSDWLDRKEKEIKAQAPVTSDSSAVKSSGKKTKEQKRQEAEERQRKYAQSKGVNGTIQTLEKNIEALKADLQKIDLFLADPANMKSPEFTANLKKRGELTKTIEQQEEEWLKLSEQN